MSFDRIVEAIIKEAMERGEFDNLPSKGKPIDLTESFEMPEEVRVANSVLKNAGMTSREVELLKEIAELKQVLAAVMDEKKKREIEKQIQQKQVEFNLMMERQKKERRSRK
jgi:DnaJ homologue, subfamily C, member 28, conserved domain